MLSWRVPFEVRALHRKSGVPVITRVHRYDTKEEAVERKDARSAFPHRGADLVPPRPFSLLIYFNRHEADSPQSRLGGWWHCHRPAEHRLNVYLVPANDGVAHAHSCAPESKGNASGESATHRPVSDIGPYVERWHGDPPLGQNQLG